jgi:hypothetical protein
MAIIRHATSSKKLEDATTEIDVETSAVKYYDTKISLFVPWQVPAFIREQTDN